jgi:hydroxymethylpyrimidine/phosphomethylpyrimidine kinase
VTAPPRLLTIAGSDSGGGAGIQADLKTFHQLGVFGTSAIVALTAQNTLGVRGVHPVPADFVALQLEALAEDLPPDALKTGMLAEPALVRLVADTVRERRWQPLVVDPVMAATSGDRLLTRDGEAAVRDLLLPLAAVVTPNLPEASALAGIDITDRDGMVEAARRIEDTGVGTVVVKGGHLGGEASPDLVWAAGEAHWLEGPRLAGRHTHGTGCVLSAAITAELARGMDPPDACVAAKAFVTRAIAAGVELGRGVGPVNPGWERAAGG